MLVSEYMTTGVVTANLRDGLRQTFVRMRERRIRHMPVLGEDGRVAGIISDRDLRRPDWVEDGPNVTHYYVLDNSIRVLEAMSADPVTVRPDDSIDKALNILVSRKYGALPVVDADARLVGILTTVDVLAAFRDHLIRCAA